MKIWNLNRCWDNGIQLVFLDILVFIYLHSLLNPIVHMHFLKLGFLSMVNLFSSIYYCPNSLTGYGFLLFLKLTIVTV